MADASVFLRKRRDKIRQRVPTNPNRPTPPPSVPIRPAGQTPEAAGAASSSGSGTAASSLSSSNNPNIVELKLFSAGDLGGTRFNLMRLHSKDEVEPSKMSQPILFNRKPRGEPAPPSLAYNAEGKVVGKYLYDPAGKPVLGADGEHVIDRTQSADLSLIGGVPGMAKKKSKRSIKEVSNLDPEQIRLKREEADPWVLESQNPAEKPEIPEHWVGLLQEPSSMPTVLLINDGTMGMSYNVVPFGRTYRFDPERPFRPLDADAANKLYEHQVRHRIHDRWAHREGGPVTITQREANLQIKQEQRAARMEEQMRLARGDAVQPAAKQERFDDDYKREGRRLERGLEGGEDEELDYDANEEFQDDEDNNTFHRNEDEEEEAKLLEERLRKEFRLANANVGDRPQIESGDESEEDDDLFGARLNIEGKRLKRMMRKRGETDDIFGSDDSDDDDDSEDEKPKEEDKGETKEDKSAPPSVERPSRPPSRGPGSRAATSPAPPARRPGGPPTPSKAGTAPPGSGAAFLAQRAASRGGSPRRSRQGSPVSGSVHGQSPDSGSVRGSSPTSRDDSPAPNGSTNGGPSKKRKTTESPVPDGPNKRKSSPTGSVTGSDAGGGSRKKKKSASATPTPRDIEPFPGMITRDEVVQWFKNAGKALVPMGEVIQAFKNRLAVEKEKNQAVFLSHVGAVTEKQPGRMLKLKDEYAS